MTMINRGPDPAGLPPKEFVTFLTGLTVSSLGAAIKFSGNYNTATGVTVVKATNGAQVGGRLEVVESDGYCGISLAGSQIQEYDFVAGATPTVNEGIQGGTVDGKVKGVTCANGGRGVVVSLDESNHKVLVLF